MQKQFFICDSLLIPIDNIIYIKEDSKENKYNIKVCDKTGKFTEWLAITPELFGQIKENLTLEKKYQKKIKKLEAKIKELELHISLSPGGREYIEAQQHFNLEKNELVKE